MAFGRDKTEGLDKGSYLCMMSYFINTQPDVSSIVNSQMGFNAIFTDFGSPDDRPKKIALFMIMVYFDIVGNILSFFGRSRRSEGKGINQRRNNQCTNKKKPAHFFLLKTGRDRKSTRLNS